MRLEWSQQKVRIQEHINQTNKAKTTKSRGRHSMTNQGIKPPRIQLKLIYKFKITKIDL